MTIYSNNNTVATGYETCATPIATIPILLGWVPQWVRIYNLTNGTKMNWVYGMTDGYGFVEPPTKNGVITTPGCSIGTTPANVANIAFYFGIAGLTYTGAAVAAGTAPTATTIPQNLWGLFGFEIGTDSVIALKDAAGNAAGYASEALAIAAKPTATAAHVLFMYVTVMRTNAAGFVGATTSFADAETTAHFYNADLTGYAQTLGISVLNDGANRGFNIGAHTQLQVAGQTLYWVAGRGL